MQLAVLQVSCNARKAADHFKLWIAFQTSNKTLQLHLNMIVI